MKFVMKFGGASLANGEKIRHVAQLLKKYHDDGNEIVVIVSALFGVTDKLIANAAKISKKNKTKHIDEFIESIKELHYDAIAVAITDKNIKKETIKIIDDKLKYLKRAFIGICYLGELSTRSIDYISSYGERLSVPIVNGAIRSLGIESGSYTGGEIGIIVNNSKNQLEFETIYERINAKLNPVLKSEIPVIAGFIAENKDGIVKTLGRGGSDFSASIVGSALKVDEIILWKEVHGIMTSDPKIVPDAKLIPKISYIEAMELSYFGAKVLHPHSIEPAIKKKIPVRVKNIFEPDFDGTLIVSNNIHDKDVVRAISLIDEVSLLNISGVGMFGVPGVIARVFTVLANAGVNIIMISQGSSEANISIVIDDAYIDSIISEIVLEFENDIPLKVTKDKDISVIAVVGLGMTGLPGVSGRVFSALGNNHINVIMISQGSSQHNISFVVKEKDAINSVQILSNEFKLGCNS